jgi:hypothetical protein
MGNLEEAINEYSKGVAIAEGTITRDPNRPSWRRDQAAMLESLGQLQIARNDDSLGLASLLRALSLREDLASSGVEKPDWHREREDALKRVSEKQLKLRHEKEALAMALKYLAAVHQSSENGDKEDRLARALGTVSWSALLAGDISTALVTSKEAVELSRGNPKLGWLNLNLAHALLISGKSLEAEAIYLNGFHGDRNSTEWGGAIEADFRDMRLRGLPTEPMDGVEQRLGLVRIP